MKIRFTTKAIIAATTVAALLIATIFWLSPTLTVTVHNTGTTPLHDLRVHVTGQSYELGDAATGSVRKCVVRPKGESNVEITYRLDDGTEKRHAVDCYLESGYRGTIDLEVGNGELIRSSNQIRLSFP